jgi:hypothetical protein
VGQMIPVLFLQRKWWRNRLASLHLIHILSCLKHHQGYPLPSR